MKDEKERSINMIGAKCNLKDRFAKKFLTLQDEHLIYSTRQHWSVLFPVIALNVLLIAGVSIFVSLSSVIAPLYFFSFLLVALIVLTVSLEFFIKNLAEWFFHFYIVTNRKIVEVAYRPMYSKVIYEVLLDQVRCTEVDVRASGLTSELLNVGTIFITFDRPTHEKIFTIENIRDPRRAAMHLADSFEMQKYKEQGGAMSWLNNPLVNSSIT